MGGSDRASSAAATADQRKIPARCLATLSIFLKQSHNYLIYKIQSLEEITMKRIVTHEIKLEKSTKLILLVMALGILAHAFQFTAPIEDALAETLNGRLNITLHHSGIITIM